MRLRPRRVETRFAVWALLVCALAGTAAAHGPIDEQIAALSARIGRDPGNASLYLRRGELHALHDGPAGRERDHGE